MKQRGRDRKEVRRDSEQHREKLTNERTPVKAVRRFRAKPYEHIDVMEYIKKIRGESNEEQTNK